MPNHCTDILTVCSALNEAPADKGSWQTGCQRALLKETRRKLGRGAHNAYRMHYFYSRGQLNLWLENKIQPQQPRKVTLCREDVMA